jgi:hypothetical protein
MTESVVASCHHRDWPITQVRATATNPRACRVLGNKLHISYIYAYLIRGPTYRTKMIISMQPLYCIHCILYAFISTVRGSWHSIAL